MSLYLTNECPKCFGQSYMPSSFTYMPSSFTYMASSFTFETCSPFRPSSFGPRPWLGAVTVGCQLLVAGPLTEPVWGCAVRQGRQLALHQLLDLFVAVVHLSDADLDDLTQGAYNQRSKEESHLFQPMPG